MLSFLFSPPAALAAATRFISHEFGDNSTICTIVTSWVQGALALPVVTHWNPQGGMWKNSNVTTIDINELSSICNAFQWKTSAGRCFARLSLLLQAAVGTGHWPLPCRAVQQSKNGWLLLANSSNVCDVSTLCNQMKDVHPFSQHKSISSFVFIIFNSGGINIFQRNATTAHFSKKCDNRNWSAGLVQFLH